MNEKSRKVSIKKFITIFISLLAIVITVLICSYFIFFELESQLQHNLADVGKQNALALKNKIHSNHVLLEGLSENMHQQTPETIDETLQSFTIFLESYDLKRFAFCFQTEPAMPLMAVLPICPTVNFLCAVWRARGQFRAS